MKKNYFILISFLLLTFVACQKESIQVDKIDIFTNRDSEVPCFFNNDSLASAYIEVGRLHNKGLDQVFNYIRYEYQSPSDSIHVSVINQVVFDSLGITGVVNPITYCIFSHLLLNNNTNFGALIDSMELGTISNALDSSANMLMELLDNSLEESNLSNYLDS